MLSGVFVALLTPFSEDGQVDQRQLCALVEFQLSHGVNGFYLCGNTGEGMLLTENERQLVVETVVRQVRGRVPVMAHVGAPATAMAERLAFHARQAGAAAVASVPPFYFPVDRAGIETHYRRISQAAGLPLYFYNIPQATNIHLNAGLARDLFQSGVIQGLKYTSYDQLTFREIIELCGPQINVFAGPDEMLLPFLVMGAHGGIGTTYNCMPGTFVSLYQAWQTGNLEKAQKLQFQIARTILALRDFGVIPSVKAAMVFLGLPCGDPRAPLTPLSNEQRERLRHALKEIGCVS